MSTTTHRLLDEIRSATEDRDPAGLARLYADDATLTVVDPTTPPSAPRLLHGRDEIAAHLRDACGREMTHEVRDAVRDGDRIAFTTHCRYPDGGRVLCATVAGLDASGLIASQTVVQVWDA